MVLNGRPKTGAEILNKPIFLLFYLVHSVLHQRWFAVAYNGLIGEMPAMFAFFHESSGYEGWSAWPVNPLLLCLTVGKLRPSLLFSPATVKQASLPCGDPDSRSGR